jgi:hypothetical protein
LVAFYTLSPQRYSIYWDILTAEQWIQRQADEKRRAARDRELATRTFDSAGIGNPEVEKLHNLKGGDSNAGVFSNRPYRAARNGGWFSYDLKVPAGQSVRLLCTYWGSDAGPRAFDILANGVRIATEQLNFNQPGEFFDVEYELPKEALADQALVTVKIQAQPGKIAGGVYDLLVVTKNGKAISTPP